MLFSHAASDACTKGPRCMPTSCRLDRTGKMDLKSHILARILRQLAGLRLVHVVCPQFPPTTMPYWAAFCDKKTWPTFCCIAGSA